jgi:hypothetical protein
MQEKLYFINYISSLLRELNPGLVRVMLNAHAQILYI